MTGRTKSKEDQRETDSKSSTADTEAKKDEEKEQDPYWVDDLAGETEALTAALRDACLKNDSKVVRTLLEFGAVTPHTVERGTGRNAAWYAAYAGSSECLRILADWAYDVTYNEYVAEAKTSNTAKTKEGIPLTIGMKEEDGKQDDDDEESKKPQWPDNSYQNDDDEEDEVEMFIKAAADVAAKESVVQLLSKSTVWGSKPLLIAAARNKPDTIQFLLENFGIDVNITNGSGHGNTSAALMAASEGHAEVLNILAKHGADLDQPNENGTTPIMIAAQNGRVDIMTFLYLYEVNLNKLDENGMNCVALAAYHNHPPVVDFLLSVAEVVDDSAIVNFNQPSGPMEETPLGIAAMKGHVEVLGALLTSKRVDMAQTNSVGMSALFIATKLNQLEVAKLLCKQPPERLSKVTDQRDANSGMTPLFCALVMEFQDLVELLAPLSDLTVLCGKGTKTPVLVAAAAKDDYQACLTLLRCPNAYVDQTDEAGHSALSIAAKHGYFKVCDLLCQYGANINHRSKKGSRTPLQKARKYRHARVVELLERYASNHGGTGARGKLQIPT